MKEVKGKTIARIRKLGVGCMMLIAISLFQFTGTTANAAPTWISCTPVNVTTYNVRVHVKCAAAVGNIRYFAAPTNSTYTDPQNAARILSVISTAQVAGRTLSILYDPNDFSGASYGCQTNDCRPIIAVGFGQ